jgi:hypothetical protein
MISRFRPVLALALLLAVSSTAVAQPPAPAAASSPAARSPAAPPVDLDSYVSRVMQAFEVPGRFAGGRQERPGADRQGMGAVLSSTDFSFDFHDLLLQSVR